MPPVIPLWISRAAQVGPLRGGIKGGRMGPSRVPQILTPKVGRMGLGQDTEGHGGNMPLLDSDIFAENPWSFSAISFPLCSQSVFA